MLGSRAVEVEDVLRCLQELLREPAFASTLVHLVTTNGQDIEHQTHESQFIRGARNAPS